MTPDLAAQLAAIRARHEQAVRAAAIPDENIGSALCRVCASHIGWPDAATEPPICNDCLQAQARADRAALLAIANALTATVTALETKVTLAMAGWKEMERQLAQAQDATWDAAIEAAAQEALAKQPSDISQTRATVIAKEIERVNIAQRIRALPSPFPEPR